jgi:Secretion system C-terminal sorting domain/Bacterial Ig domain/NHL repeat
MKKITLAISALGLLFLTSVGAANAQRMAVTLAGSTTVGFNGENVSARWAQLAGPKDVCVDLSGNVYFIDRGNARIRIISAARGTISTYAGGGTSTASGVAATSALIDPNYMTMDALGNIYFTNGNRISRVDAVTGMLTHVAGTGAAGGTGDGGLATAATLNAPQGICIDASGNLYVADRMNNLIRTITASTGIITTLAGSVTPGYTGDGGPATAATLNEPATIAVDAGGNVYFSDQEPDYPTGFDYSVIRVVNGSTGIISTIAGNAGSSASAVYGVPDSATLLGTITGMTVDGYGQVYCCEMSCSCREINVTNDSSSLVGGNFYAQSFTDYINSYSADMYIPYGVAIDGMGSVYIADSGNNRVRKLVQITHTPTFLTGEGQSIEICGTTGFNLDTTLAITDLDSAQLENWTILTAPAGGTLSGLPYSTPNTGILHPTFPASVTYTPSTAFAGADSFQVQVSDGEYSDVVTVYVAMTPGCPMAVKSLAAATKGLDIFPNPASSVLNVSLSSWSADAAQFTISDVTDRVLSTTSMTGVAGHITGTIDIAAYPAGVYFLTVKGGETVKFVKE